MTEEERQKAREESRAHPEEEGKGCCLGRKM